MMNSCVRQIVDIENAFFTSIKLEQINKSLRKKDKNVLFEQKKSIINHGTRQLQSQTLAGCCAASPLEYVVGSLYETRCEQ